MVSSTAGDTVSSTAGETVSSTAGGNRAAELVRPNDPDHLDALVFLMSEAELLDAGDFGAWLDLLGPDATYKVPVRTTRLREDEGAGERVMFHVDDDRATLDFRVKRILETNSSWAYNPQSRTRRFVSNVRVRRGEGTELNVSSYILLMRSRHDQGTYDFVTGERNDRLGRRPDGVLELQAREVTLDQSRVGISAIPFPI
jgi:3-phenylpropionate/cinnamic acid dioxygenase small subunit